jgi:hypothetical protein
VQRGRDSGPTDSKFWRFGRPCSFMARLPPKTVAETAKVPPSCWELANVYFEDEPPGSRAIKDLVGRDFVDSTSLGHCALPPRRHGGRTHFTNKSQAYYLRSVSVYSQSNVLGPRHSYAWHRNLPSLDPRLTRAAGAAAPVSPIFRATAPLCEVAATKSDLESRCGAA